MDTWWVFYPRGWKSMIQGPQPIRPDLWYEHSMCKHSQWCKKIWQPNSLSLSHTHQFWVREKLLHVSLIIMSLRSCSSKIEKSKEGKRAPCRKDKHCWSPLWVVSWMLVAQQDSGDICAKPDNLKKQAASLQTKHCLSTSLTSIKQALASLDQHVNLSWSKLDRVSHKSLMLLSG